MHRNPLTGGRVPRVHPGKPLADGHRLLTVAAVEPETELVTSYWLASPDRAALPAPAAGQFLPIAVDAPRHGVLRRSYTISACEAGRYRLSIKRERLPGQPLGRVGNHVHDHWAVGDRISAGAPQGQFVLDRASRRPIVLLAGGIGITPLLAMLRE
jgi:ferredoxin-NADP reductase